MDVIDNGVPGLAFICWCGFAAGLVASLVAMLIEIWSGEKWKSLKKLPQRGVEMVDFFITTVGSALITINFVIIAGFLYLRRRGVKAGITPRSNTPGAILATKTSEKDLDAWEKYQAEKHTFGTSQGFQAFGTPIVEKLGHLRELPITRRQINLSQLDFYLLEVVAELADVRLFSFGGSVIVGTIVGINVAVSLWICR